MFPIIGIPEETKWFPDLTEELPQIDAFPHAIGDHSDLFRAHRINDKRRGKVLALKTLRAGSSSNPGFETLQKRLSELGDRWVQLVHRNVAWTYEAAYGSGRLPAIVMDYDAGGSIASRMKAQTTTDEEKLQWVKDIASGMKYLHRKETPVVHGDLRGANLLVNAGKESVLADQGMIHIVGMSEFTVMKSAAPCRWVAPELMDPDFVMKPAAASYRTAPDLLSSRHGRSHVEGSATSPTPEGDASAEAVQVPPPCSPSADAAGQSGDSHEQWAKTESCDTTGEGAKTGGENGKLEIVGYAEQVRVERIGTTQAGRDVTIHKTYNYYLPPETDHILAGRTSQLETSFSSLLKDFSSMSQDLASSANVSSDLRQRIESIDSRLRRLEQLIADSVGSPHMNVGPSGISVSPLPGWVAPILPQPMVTLPLVASTPTPSAACPTFTWVPVPIALFYAPPMAGSVAPMPTGMPVVPPPHSGDLDTPPVPQTSIPPNSPLATSTSTVSP